LCNPIDERVALILTPNMAGLLLKDWGLNDGKQKLIVHPIKWQARIA
jgi:hypothetical protein